MLLGRLFMMVVFADSIQVWLASDAEIDALTSATPLGLLAAEGVAYSPLKILYGEIGGDWELSTPFCPARPARCCRFCPSCAVSFCIGLESPIGVRV
jgi:hypothetical protein